MKPIICSAIWYKDQPTAAHNPKNVDRGVVVCGHRHNHCMATFSALTGKRSVEKECGEYVQGFLTINNTFMDRKQAAELAFNSGQIPAPSSMLFSEDIY